MDEAETYGKPKLPILLHMLDADLLKKVPDWPIISVNLIALIHIRSVKGFQEKSLSGV
jgi:hypothetical protein